MSKQESLLQGIPYTPINGEIRETPVIPTAIIPNICSVLIDMYKHLISTLPPGDDLDDAVLWFMSDSKTGASFINCTSIIGVSRDGADEIRERWCMNYLEKMYGKGKKGRSQIVSIIHDNDGDVCKAVLVQISANKAQGKRSQNAAREHSASGI
ncbi:hypothetical protein [Acidithiobacillus sp.]|uniref:hypothetical protein n=1 Tax=Acidithiobacillus sp. TaxID=1872118 RepID=UPI00260A79EF|nr:hypothetical protein [Acidithiobacillus sp.]MDD5278677.1 hypothetical protein [Acidithiobacillus sp.]